jgi:hypothetical protein
MWGHAIAPIARVVAIPPAANSWIAPIPTIVANIFSRFAAEFPAADFPGFFAKLRV